MTIALVQTAQGHGGGVTASATIGFAGDVTGGNLLVLQVSTAADETVGVSDDKSNTWARVETLSSRGELWYAYDVAGGSTTITVSISTPRDVALIAREYSGFGESDPLETSAAASGSSTSPTSGATGALSGAEALVVAGVGTSGNPTYTAGSGYGNLVEQFGAAAFTAAAVADRIVSTTTAQTASFTTSGSVAWCCTAAVFVGDTEPPPPPTIALVQTAKGTGTGYVQAVEAEFDSAVTTGNLIVVSAGGSNGATDMTITDSQSNTYHRVWHDATSNRQAALWYAYNVTGGSVTVTCTTSGFNDMALVAQEFSGFSDDDPLDVYVRTARTSAFVQSHPTGSTDPLTGGEALVVAAIGANNAAPGYSISGYGNLVTQGSSDASNTALAHRVVDTTDAQSATFTSTAFVQSVSGVVVFTGAPPGVPEGTFTVHDHTHVAATGEAPDAVPFGDPSVISYISYTDQTRGVAAVREHAGSIGEVTPSWWAPAVTADGSVVLQESGVTVEDPAFVAYVQAMGGLVRPAIANYYGSGVWDWDPVSTIINDSGLRADHIEAIVSLVTTKGYDGIDLDYEHGLAADRAAFTTFVTELATALHDAGKTLSIVVHPKTAEPGPSDKTQVQDWRALAAVVDQFRIMLYDYDPAAGAGPQSPISWWRQVARYALAQVPASKLVLGAPHYGYDWNLTSSSYTDRMWDEFPALAATHSATPVLDPAEQEKTFTYGSDPTREVWYQDAETLAARAAVVRAHGISGMHFWRAGGEDPDSWSAVAEALETTGSFTAEVEAVADCYLDAGDTDKHQGVGDLAVKASLERRTLLHFDLSWLPDDATVTSVDLSLVRTSIAGTDPVGRTYQCYRLTQTGWIETANGNPAAAGATWVRYNEPSSAWTTPGGDFTTTDGVTATVPAGNGDPMVWNVTALATDAVTNRSGQLHVIIKDSVTTGNHQCFFASRENATVNNRPKLTVNYTVGVAAGQFTVIDESTAAAAGERDSEGTVSTVDVSTVTWVGDAPEVDAAEGQFTAVDESTVTTAGARDSAGTATAEATDTVTAVGARTSEGAASLVDETRVTWSSSTIPEGQFTATDTATVTAAGERASEGTATAADTVTVSWTGSAPAVGGASGTFTVLDHTHAETEGARDSAGTATAQATDTVTATGARDSAGTATAHDTTHVTWAGQASELAVPTGQFTVVDESVLDATGERASTGTAAIADHTHVTCTAARPSRGMCLAHDTTHAVWYGPYPNGRLMERTTTRRPDPTTTGTRPRNQTTGTRIAT